MLHSPVLLEESIDFLITNTSGIYIDATFGRGGHSRKILDSMSKDGKLFALDKDIEAVRFAKENFKDNNFSIQHAGFENLDSILIYREDPLYLGFLCIGISKRQRRHQPSADTIIFLLLN